MHKISGFKSNKRSHSGDNGSEDPPVPIPNTEVKLTRAESTCRDTDREDRSLPDFKRHSNSFGLLCLLLCKNTLVRCPAILFGSLTSVCSRNR